MDCPCKGCNERQLTCHSTCVSYKRWSKERRKHLAYIRECKELDEQFARIKTDTCEKKRKCHRR